MPYNGPKEKQEERFPELGVSVINMCVCVYEIKHVREEAINSIEKLGVYELEQIVFFLQNSNLTFFLLNILMIILFLLE